MYSLVTTVSRGENAVKIEKKPKLISMTYFLCSEYGISKEGKDYSLGISRSKELLISEQFYNLKVKSRRKFGNMVEG